MTRRRAAGESTALIYRPTPTRVVCRLCNNGWDFESSLEAAMYQLAHGRCHSDSGGRSWRKL